MKQNLNNKRRKKMKRKVKRKDVGWEEILAEITKYEILLAKEKERNGKK
jgi:CRISPR/Cas system CSM-associated protein Csm2 small subunit